MENLFKDFYSLVTNQNCQNKIFMIIGCGGTGSAFVRDAARMVSVAKEEGQNVKMILCDADVVEDSNLKRQCFAPRDVGRNKAAVLAQRYGGTFDIDMSYIDRYIEDQDDLNQIISDNWMSNAALYIFSFVDNVKTRLMLHNFVVQYVREDRVYRRFMWIDAGNTEFAGQVAAYSNKVYHINGATREAIDSTSRCQDIVELRRDLLDPANWDKFASELSCEEAAIHHPQTMAANTTAANIALNMCFGIMFDKTQLLDYNMVTFAANKNSYRTTRQEDIDFQPVGLVTITKEGV